MTNDELFQSINSLLIPNQKVMYNDYQVTNVQQFPTGVYITIKNGINLPQKIKVTESTGITVI